MPRLFTWLVLLATAGAVPISGCGFGLADDTGKPLPADYWKWACPDGGAPRADGGCAPEQVAPVDSTGKMP
jgi:hypothetical protein